MSRKFFSCVGKGWGKVGNYIVFLEIRWNHDVP